MLQLTLLSTVLDMLPYLMAYAGTYWWVHLLEHCMRLLWMRRTRKRSLSSVYTSCKTAKRQSTVFVNIMPHMVSEWC